MGDLVNYGGARNLANVTDIAGGDPNTGEMRRKYNFADKFTELSIDQTPFFRLVSKIGKKPTDDPQFKFTEKRQSWMKRYAYCITNGIIDTEAEETKVMDAATFDGKIDIADTILFMGTDYLSHGNIQNVIGQAGASIGSAGTQPQFYLPQQVVKVNYGTVNDGTFTDFALYRITEVTLGNLCHTAGDGSAVVGGFLAGALPGDYTPAEWYECAKLDVEVVKAPSQDDAFVTTNVSGAFISDASPNSAYDNSIAEHLEIKRSYVTGTAYTEGSTLMQKNWADQPYSTGYGLTQIFRTEFGMTNTARATMLRYEADEWARLWRDKLIEHKWEIEQTALFGSQVEDVTAGVNYTQGAVDYILSNCNLFGWDNGKTQDSFLEDLSQLVDPRYNNSKKMMFFCNTEVYNWVYRLNEGYLQANLGAVNALDEGHPATWDFATKGGKNAFGINFSTISTPYGDINMARCIALDNSGVKIMGVNMDYVKWRPLVGNGVNRDTSVYVGVQTLANTGTDKRVDMILTEGGFEWKMPECHAIWK